MTSALPVDEVEARHGAERAERLAENRSAFDRLASHVEQTDPRARHLRDPLRIGGAHDRELHELGAFTADRSADVEQQAERVLTLVAHLAGKHAGKRGAAHAGNGAKAPGAGKHAGAGVSRRYQRVGLPRGDQLGANDERAVVLVTDRLLRFLLHADHRAGVNDVDALAAVGLAREQVANAALVPHQDARDLGFDRHPRHAMNDFVWGEISPHGIDRDRRHGLTARRFD